MGKSVGTPAVLVTEPVDSCAVCGETESILLFCQSDQLMPDGVLHITECRACSLVYLNPRLTHKSVQILEDESTVYDFPQEVAEERINRLQELLKELEQFTPRRGRLLDIGSNRGLWLEAGRRIGWQVVGVEPSPVAAARARDDFGVDVYRSLDDVANHGSFDLAVAWHVLEHTPYPVVFLRQVAQVLSSDGVLAIQVPSFEFLEEFKRRSELHKLVCAVHNYCFTEQTIRSALARTVLRPIWVCSNPGDLMLTVICTKNLAVGR